MTTIKACFRSFSVDICCVQSINTFKFCVSHWSENYNLVFVKLLYSKIGLTSWLYFFYHPRYCNSKAPVLLLRINRLFDFENMATTCVWFGRDLNELKNPISIRPVSSFWKGLSVWLISNIVKLLFGFWLYNTFSPEDPEKPIVFLVIFLFVFSISVTFPLSFRILVSDSRAPNTHFDSDFCFN